VGVGTHMGCIMLERESERWEELIFDHLVLHIELRLYLIIRIE